jgi:transposase-like protein
MGGRVWSEEDKARMLELYGQGWDTSSLAEMFDRTEDAVLFL